MAERSSKRGSAVCRDTQSEGGISSHGISPFRLELPTHIVCKMCAQCMSNVYISLCVVT